MRVEREGDDAALATVRADDAERAAFLDAEALVAAVAAATTVWRCAGTTRDAAVSAAAATAAGSGTVGDPEAGGMSKTPLEVMIRGNGGAESTGRTATAVAAVNPLAGSATVGNA
jgi:hypothetical protein